MNRRLLLLGILIACGLLIGWQMWGHSPWGNRPQEARTDIERSVRSFGMGDQLVIIDSGSSEGGNRLRYLVIRAYPQNSTTEERLADTRYDSTSRSLPRLRHPDGTMRPVDTDGRAYLFIGNELRVMRVKMNGQTDLDGLHRADSLEGMWAYLQQFRVAD